MREPYQSGEPAGGTVADLRDRVEELARRWVLSNPQENREEWVPVLDGIRDSARTCGNDSLANLAVELARAAVEGGPEGPEDEFGARMEDGIRRLQEAVVAQPEQSKPPQALSEDRELVTDFITESRGHLVSIETHLLAFEQDPSNTEPVHAIFRAFHTIKGLAGFLEF
jgi:two-component system, chemotaxis family, sensor kinase CheA